MSTVAPVGVVEGGTRFHPWPSGGKARCGRDIDDVLDRQDAELAGFYHECGSCARLEAGITPRRRKPPAVRPKTIGEMIIEYLNAA